MSLGSDREMAQNKLILLYLIDRINMPVSNLQITKIILENKFMNYFFLQQFLKELNDGSMLTSSQSEGKTMYSITAKGSQTLNYFPDHIPAGIKSRIDDTISVVRKNIRNETLITADYSCESENEFVVTCKVREDNFMLMEINVTVGSKIDARAICDNWKQHSQTIYSDIISTLTKNRKPQA
jgi:predicted transcriptional regulator